MSLNKLARIVVFGGEYCSFCNKAKALLSKSGAKFSYLDVEEEDVLLQLQEYQRKHNYRTIPMIFIDEKFVGGYRELYHMVQEKQIDLSEFK